MSEPPSVDVRYDRHYDSAQRMARLGSFLFDFERDAMTWTPEFGRLLALPDDVRPSLDVLLALVTGDQQAGFRADLERTIAGAAALERDVTMRTGAGEHRTFRVRAELVVDLHGTSGVVGTLQDVTAVRQVEQRLVENTWRARQLIQAMPDAVVVIDADGRIEEVNDEAVRLFGYDAAELIGRPVEVLVPLDRHRAHTAHRATFTATAPRTTMATGAAIEARRRDGSHVPVEVNLTRIDLPTGTAVLASVRNVSAARSLQRELSITNDLLRAVLHGATEQAIIATDPTGRVTVFNRGAEIMVERTAADMLGRSVLELHDPAELERRARELGAGSHLAALTDVARSGQPETREWTYLTGSGGRITVSLVITAMIDGTGERRGFIGVASDVTARRAAERALLESEERFRLAFEDAPVGMALIGLDVASRGTLLRVNRALCRLTGLTASALVGRAIDSLSEAGDPADSHDALEQLSTGRIGNWHSERRWRHASGRTVWIRLSVAVVRSGDGARPYTVAQIEDITDRKRAQDELIHLALHDALTGLPNRALLTEHLSGALARAARAGTHVGVLFIDLDDFKTINDSLGHSAGDDLLVEVSERLRGALRDCDLAARLGGDEFVMVCEDLHSPDDIELVAERIAERLGVELTIRDRSVHLSSSIGVATSAPDATPESMLRDADAAMYRAKEAGRGRFELADRSVQARALRQLTLEVELRRAITGDGLSLAYQPFYDLETGNVVAVEALLRWDHPGLGALLPDAFLDVAESRNLIVPLGRWVIETACRQAAAWRDELGGTPRVWVNISSRQLGRHRLARTIGECLERHALAADRFGIELTERQVISATPDVLTDLDALRSLGVGVAIDDFGTGHNGLTYLRQIPVTALKIDRSFVAGLGRDRIAAAVTNSVIALARSLDLELVAEGIETVEQQRDLRRLGCTLGQGYLLGRPTAPDALLATLAGHTYE